MDAASALDNGMEGPARWSLRLFGDFQLTERPGGEKVALPGKRERVLLAYLALSPNGRQPRRKLVTLLWGEAADETTLDNLRTSVFNLRKALADTERSIVASEDRDIVLDTSAFEVDVLTFRSLAAASPVANVEEAAKLYAGDFLDGLSIESEEFESWRREESTRCKGQVLDALTKLMTQLAASGESERAIETGLRILRLEPLHEGAVRRLMRLYAESGRRATAVELYHTLAESLKKELGAQPEAETRAVYAELSRGENAPRATAAADAAMAPTPLSWPATLVPAKAGSGHPGDEGLSRRVDTRVPDGVPAKAGITQGHDKWGTVIRSRWTLAGGLAAAAAVAVLLFGPFAPSFGPAPTGQPATVIAATPTSAIALAVLPFANLSSDPEQEFFSDGLTEEISSALAKIPELSVVARTSAFEFKGQNRNIRTIGEQLGATHLIEGSVRKAGDRVRITVQLIRAGDGTRIWSDDYDRQLTDIFVIQEDIAQAIAGALRVPLGLQQGESLVSNRAIAPESYQQYLQARASLRNRGNQAGASLESYAAAIEMLEQVVARDPLYTPAWGLLALRSRGDAKQERQERAARETIRLDPRNAAGYAALADHAFERGNFVSAEDLFRQALALDPNDPDVLEIFSNRLATVGRIKETLSLRERLRTLEPFVPQFNTQTANFMLIDGQNRAAIAIIEALPPAVGRNLSLAHAYASEGRYEEAADALLAVKEAANPELGPLEDAARLLRIARTKVKAPEALPVFRNQLLYVYAYIGALDRGLEQPERVIAEGNVLGAQDVRHLWSPEYAPIRKTERFKALMRNAGFVDYWRTKGWPDLCRPVGADDFVCD